jgi:hypothetical protein
MGTARNKKDVIAIACADIHLSLNPPLARKGEEQQPGGWFSAMARPLKELEDLKMDLGGVPILCAGDVFDRHNPSPELINFAMDHLPEMYAIPGQHDLPFHSYADIEKSAYWTMVKHERVHNLKPAVGTGILRNGLSVWGWPWGTPVVPCPLRRGGCLNVALVHEYTWIDGAGYPGAPQEAKAAPRKYDGYDVVIIGDNHISWSIEERACKEDGGDKLIFNCGGFYRRKSDEVNHRPRVGLIHADGSVESHYLDCSKDILGPTAHEEQAIVSSEVAAFVSRLRSLQGMSLDYREELMRAVVGQPDDVKKLIVEALG